MSEPTKADHWADLASALGAEPPPEAEKPQEQAVDKAVSGDEGWESGRRDAARPSKPKPKSAPKRTPADWSRLASDLGLSPPVEPPLTSPLPDAVAETPRGEEGQQAEEPPSPAPSFLDVVAIEAEAGQVLPGFEELAEEFDDTAPLLADNGLTPADARADSRILPPQMETERDAAVDRGAGKRRRKRRRRPRKPAERDSEQVSFEASLSETEEGAREPEESSLPPAFVQEDPEGLGTAAPAAAEAEPSGKLKRRRRRRGADRKKGHGTDGTERLPEEPGVSLAEDEDSIGSAEDDQEDAESLLAAKEDRAAGEQSGKFAHRGIPTWREAVEIVISANLESRAKRPSDRSSSRQRSGHRPPRRDKPSDKPG